MATAAAQTPIVIREITDISEMREVEELQRQVWGISDREVFPALALVPMIELGAVLLGAFAGDRMAGLCFRLSRFGKRTNNFAFRHAGSRA